MRSLFTPAGAVLQICIIIGISASLLLCACGDDDDDDDTPPPNSMDYKQEMRHFVQELSGYAKGIDPDFIIIPQNGQEIVTRNGSADGSIAVEYLNAIDGVGREDLFYGYDADNQPTPLVERNYLSTFLDICERNGVEVLVTDYCHSQEKMDSSYRQNRDKGYISFAAPERDLSIIPDYPRQPFNVNSNDVATLADAKNFLYLINPENFSSKRDFVNAVLQTDYDLILIDAFFNTQEFTVEELAALKRKRNGGSRLVIAYLSIGEAEDYRYYWQEGWKRSPPAWLDAENPNWKGNYKVRYWDKGWQGIIFGGQNSYLQKILDAGFDGVYLDIIDAFEYFEG
jgi:cysteinyl-tRNA synthetase, unknown class